MWCGAVLVVVVAISSVASVVDVRNNDIFSGESLQDLVTRTKKSPDVFGLKKNWDKSDKKRTWNDSPDVQEESGILESDKLEKEVSGELTSLLVEDIKEKLEGLRKLENSYSELKNNRAIANSKENKVNELQKQKLKTLLEPTIPEEKNLDDEESVRNVRQYIQDSINYQKFYGGSLVNTDDTYNNKFQDSAQSHINMYGDKGDPYLGQYMSSARTYEPPSTYEGEKTEHKDPIRPIKQLKQIIPNVINTLAQITTPSKPSGGHPEHSGHHHSGKKPEHGAHRPPPSVHVHPPPHEHRPIGVQPFFFSKQLIFGVGSDKKLDNKNYYGNAYPEVQSYPSQSYYPSVYSYYAPASYWAPHRDEYATSLNSDSNAYNPSVYPLNQEAQTSYDPSQSQYPQGNSYIEQPNSQNKPYYPSESNYKSVLNPYDVSDGVSIYRNEEVTAKDLSQASLRVDSFPKPQQNQIEKDLESEIKKVQHNIEAVEIELQNLLNNTNLNLNKNKEGSESVKKNPIHITKTRF